MLEVEERTIPVLQTMAIESPFAHFRCRSPSFGMCEFAISTTAVVALSALLNRIRIPSRRMCKDTIAISALVAEPTRLLRISGRHLCKHRHSHRHLCGNLSKHLHRHSSRHPHGHLCRHSCRCSRRLGSRHLCSRHLRRILCHSGADSVDKSLTDHLFDVHSWKTIR